MKNILDALIKYVKVFFKWLTVATVVGALGGVLGSVFHICVDYVTELREEREQLLFLLPVGGVIIAGLYHIFKSAGRLDTNRVFVAARGDENVPFVMVPLIFISTVITHMLGGSAGREGAALQLGGGIGYNFGKLLKLNKKDMRIMVMSGMSSVFAALFGTPLTAAVFSLEVINVGRMNYVGFLPCIISSVVSYNVARMFGISPVEFKVNMPELLSPQLMLQVIILAVLCAVVSIIFCTAIKKCEHYMDKLMPNIYVRAFVGGAAIVVLTMILNTYDYNGAGMNIIERAMTGEARHEAFILKIIFTAITISAGFKGGEIVPTFFIGSTFGCAVAPLLGIDAGLGAAIGFVALFCGVVNCPIASLLLSIEVFGDEGLLFFAVACAVTYLMSGSFSLYKEQKIVYSRLDE